MLATAKWDVALIKKFIFFVPYTPPALSLNAVHCNLKPFFGSVLGLSPFNGEFVVDVGSLCHHKVMIFIVDRAITVLFGIRPHKLALIGAAAEILLLRIAASDFSS